MKLSDRAYNRFKDRVFAGELKPGQIVSQREVIALVGVPLAPVRDALQRLSAEGLVEVIPQRGIKIAEVSLRLVRDAFGLRMIIEREAVRNYAEQASDADILALAQAHRDIVRRAKRGIDDALLEETQRLDRHMHDEMVRALDNELLWRIHENNVDRIRLIRLDHGLVTRRNLFHVMEEHLAVVEACKARDAKAAGRAIENHISTAMRRAMGV